MRGVFGTKCMEKRDLVQENLDQIVETRRNGPKVFSRGSETFGVGMVILWVKEVFNMKIEPRHDYKKPLYIAGLTTMIGASMLLGTACGDDVATKIDVRSGHNDPVVELGGEAQLAGETDAPYYEGTTDVDIEGEVDGGDVELAGDVDVVDYAGGEDIAPEYTEDTEG